MPDFVTLTCPSCGGKLQVTNDLERFACGYCGIEHVVKRAGGIVSLSPVVEAVQQVKAGVDKTASELAIKRLQGEIASLRTSRMNEEGRWKGSNYGWGCLGIFFPALIGFMALIMNGSAAVIIFFFALAVILGIVIFSYLGKEKAQEQIKWDRMDALINQKQKELAYHQGVVSKV